MLICHKVLYEDQSLSKLLERDFQESSCLIVNKQAEIKELFEYQQALEKAKRIIFQLSLIQRRQLEEFRIVAEQLQRDKARNQKLLDKLHTQVIQLEDEKERNKQANQNQIENLTKTTQLLEQEKNKQQELLLKEIKVLETEKIQLSSQLSAALEKQKLLEKQNNYQNYQINLLEKQSNPSAKQQEQIKKINQQTIDKILEYSKRFDQSSQQQQQKEQLNTMKNKCQVFENIGVDNLKKTFNNSQKQENEMKSINDNSSQKPHQKMQRALSYKCKTTLESNQEAEIVVTNELLYILMSQHSKKQSEYCKAICFNKEQTIMVAGCGSKIIVFDFKHGQLQERQLLDEHTVGIYIFTLYFMKNSNQFISGTTDQIGIWSYNDIDEKWYSLQLMKQAHSDDVNRVIMNKKEDFIISCSSDSTIKFWIKKYKWQCSQTLTDHSRSVHSICLNESFNKEQILNGKQYRLLMLIHGDTDYVLF